MSIRLVFACAIACCFSSPAYAHHGIDFLLVQTAHLPEQGTVYALARVDQLSEDHDETEFEPAMLYGATNRLAVEVHAHYEKEEGEPSNYESLAPAIHFRLTPIGNAFSVGVSAEYEITHDSSEENAFELATVFGYQGGRWMAAGNVLYGKRSGESSEWGYSAGVRRTLGGKHGVGVELLDSFESFETSEVLIAYYGELSERFTLNVGIGTGLDEGPDRTARLGFIWRLK